ncbi:MAG: Hsp33 family molecular chaperone HslO [Candidatus Heteroscillospira sp.]|jgi:molecular chaperone Hsp33
MGEIIRAVSGDGLVKISVIEGRDIAERARMIHGTSATATAALGRSLCATAILGDMLKEEKASITVRINGGGALGTLMTVSDSSGNVRGYVQNPEADLPTRADGKLDVGGLVGKNGMMTVSRDFGYGEPYIGSTELVSGEIAEDYTSYYCSSEQTQAACGLGVLVDTDLSVRSAGGFLVQLLPGADDSVISALEANIAVMPAVSDVLMAGDGAALVNYVLLGMEPEILERHPAEYRCYCSRQRVAAAIASIGAKALEEMAADTQPTRVSCQFCDAEYVFTPEEIGELAQQSRENEKN